MDDDHTPRRPPARPFHWADLFVLGFDIIANLADAVNDTALQARNLAVMHANHVADQHRFRQQAALEIETMTQRGDD